MSTVGPLGLDSRQLHKRGRLVFNFPKEGGPGQGHYSFFLPFYENPIIKESKKAKYAKYQVMSRPSTLYTYTGADARSFKVEFNMTLPHMAQHDMGIDKYRRLVTADSRRVMKALFKDKVRVEEGIESASIFASGQRLGNGAYERYFLKLLENAGGTSTDEHGNPIQTNTTHRHTVTMSSTDRLLSNGLPLGGQGIFKDLEVLQPNRFTTDLTYTKSSHERRQILDTYLYFVNLIRSSVYNNAEDPTLGPPIVRIEYGSMFQSIPCIVQSYAIAPDDKVGYDLRTLLPRRIKFSLSMNELRAGDFTKYEGVYESDQVVKRDNLSGWEVMIDQPLTMDPGEYVAFSDNPVENFTPQGPPRPPR